MRALVYSIAFVMCAACGKTGESTSSSSGGGSEYSCKIFVKKKAAGAPVEGHASDADEAKAKDAAWKEACGKLPAADQPNCHDKDKWSAAESGGSMAMNGKTTFSASVKLEQNLPQFTGKAKSTTSEDDACKQATADACKAAGAAGDCVAAGGFEQQGKSTEKTSRGM